MALRVATPPVQDEVVVLSAKAMDASKIVYIRADCNKYSPATSSIDWREKNNKAHSLAFYKSRTNVLGGTITLNGDADVDDGNTFLLNGLTFTAESAANDAVASARKYLITGNVAEDVASLAALLNDATYGVPGLLFTAASPVITISPLATGALPDGARTILFQQGTSDVTEIAFANTTLASLTKDSTSSITGIADNSTTSGTLYQQYADGYPYCWLGITDTSAAESTLTVGYSLHDSL